MSSLRNGPFCNNLRRRADSLHPAMIILTGIIGRPTPPAADGIPYEK